MSILSQLSSQRRDRSEYSNRKAAVACLEDPALLEAVAGGLERANPSLLGDCCEVMAMVAADRPDWVAPYAPRLARLLHHPKTRVRWEAAHAVALVAAVDPGSVEPHLDTLAEIMRGDESVIARDYAVTALASYAGSGESAARAAYPLLREALRAFDGKQAHHALFGLAQAAGMLPEKHAELTALAAEFAGSRRGVVKKAARALEKALLLR